MRNRPGQGDTPLSKPIRLWGASTWIAIAILLVDVVMCWLLQINPLAMIGDLHRELGLLFWMPSLLLWLAVVAWRLWRDRRQAIFRSLRCGVIVFGMFVPLSSVSKPLFWVGSMAIAVQAQRSRLSRQADIPAIRQWAQQYQPKPNDWVLPSGEVVVRDENLPPYIQKLGPLAGVFFDPKTKVVRITQGSGLGHWGIGVSPTDVWTFDSE